MDFLKSAVASAISKGPSFPYSFGDKVDIDQSIWTLYNGTKREDGSSCSIFSFDVLNDRSRLPLARNALKKLRTLRHPGVIKILESVETDSYIYIATERVVPLRWHIKRKSSSPETIKWGLNSIATTVKFINNEASSIHGNIKVASVYTSESGEWKLGGFELLSNVKEDDAVIYSYGSLVPDARKYAPPELARDGWDAIKNSPHSAVDSFNFGALIFEVFNGDYTGPEQAGTTKNIPPSMQSSYKRLVNAMPKARLSVGHFLDQGARSGGFFDSPLIKLTEGIDNLGMKSQEERDEFLSDLDQLADDFPEDFFKMKVLPELLKSVEFGGGGPKALSVVLKIAAKLSNEDFEAKVTPVVVRLFAIPDRVMRVSLLDNLHLMIDRLSQKVVNDKIFPQIVSGFTDLAPVVREQTLKSVLVLISKLSDRTINGELLRHLAKTANDEQPGIRTNTTICLGKIAKNLGSSSRSKVLSAAFLRSLRDPFVHARHASLMALSVTSDYFSDEDCAVKILPALCPALLDKEKLIRDQTTKTIEVYLQKVRKAASTMPETILPPQRTPEVSVASEGSRSSTPQPTESASSWTGWAISSFTNKVSAAAGEMESGTSARASSDNNSTLDPKRPSSSSASALHRQAVKSPVPGISRTPSQVATATAAEFFSPGSNPGKDDDDDWGAMDDMADEEADNSFADEAVPSATSPASTKAPTTAKKTTAGSRQNAEPDFAGWLAAQEKKKGGAVGTGATKKTLPKGLSKTSSSSSTVAGGASKKTSKSVITGKPIVKKAVEEKKVEPKPDDDDGWGDAW